jgi:tetratricopeptide (TPR) repeat protein
MDAMMKQMEAAMKDMDPETRKMISDAQKTVGELQKAGITGNQLSTNVPPIPVKHTKLLAAMPSIGSQQQYDSYLSSLLADCKLHIGATVVKSVDDLFVKCGNDIQKVSGLPAALLLTKQPGASAYAALKAAQQFPSSKIVQNNLGVTLFECGYPQKAIPVFQYTITQFNTSEVQCNTAQCYLALGDTVNARKYFMGSLAMNANNCEANCGIGYLLEQGGKKEAATPFIQKSLKNGYSEMADIIIAKDKLDIDFNSIKPVVPEYINPQKYKPLAAAKKLEDVLPRLAEQQALHDLAEMLTEKYEATNNASISKDVNLIIKEAIDRNRGYIINTPMSRKARLITEIAMADYVRFAMSSDFNGEVAKVKVLEKALDENIDHYRKTHSFISMNDNCKNMKPFVENYLQQSAQVYESYVRFMLPKLYDLVNQNAYWRRYLHNQEQYQLIMYSFVKDLVLQLDGYTELQPLYPTPEYYAKDCLGRKEVKAEKKDTTLDIPDAECPITIEIPIGVAKGKWNCKGWEVEGGEGLVFNVSKDYKTGEFIIFGGVGVGIYEKGFGVGGVEASAKAGSFVKIGSDFTVVDCGNYAEAGAEAGIGPFITEAKVTGTMGMQSGVSVDRVVAGQQTNIFTMK